jgi:preprotein translocase subunit YajC
MIASISRGTTVITAGGFWGKVCEILDDSYIIDLSRPDGEPVKVRILKTSVMMKKTEGDKAEHPKKKRIKKSHSTAEESKSETEGAEVTEAKTETADQPETETVQQPAAEAPSGEEKA